MRFETFVALRYLRGKRKNRFISLISLISVAGVSVGVIALIVVLGVMTGFQIALRDTIIGNRAHLMILNADGWTLENYQDAIEEIEAVVPEIQASGPFMQVETLLQNSSGRRTGQVTTYAFLIGVEPELESEVTELAANLTKEDGRSFGAGALPGKKEVVLGYQLAHSLGVHIGDKISVFTPSHGKKKPMPWGAKQAQQLLLTVSGISHAKMSEFDALFGWVNIPTAMLLSGKEGPDGIHSRIEDPFKAEEFARRIERKLGYSAVTWHENQLAFFEALRQEKFMMFIILVFIVLVAAFNITSTLIMMVMEKQRDIGILRTIGVSSTSILRLFMIEGLIIGLAGTAAGVILGMLLARYLNPIAEFIAPIFGIDLFNSQIYYFDQIPVEVVPRDVLIITVASVILSFLSTLYPAWSASRLDPVDALRYE
ncbi:MAG: lipoprotein-releasing ABC transporter permease subunit [Candidatus Hydrogenedentes bacterium]|nr:lipoprotein-releasing ABC transporter permease subunit [Candidatus Hydrogenedentota bacterium]